MIPAKRPRVFLIDDEPLAITRLRRLLEHTGRVEICGQESDPQTALQALNESSLPVDALFLDIQMPILNGFEFLSRLRQQPFVIFTTAFDAYALQAFEVNSLDYLLKPIEPQQLERALGRIERLTEAPRTPNWQEVAAQVTAAIRTQTKTYPMRIASRLGERVRFLELAQITHFYAQDKLTYAAGCHGQYIVDRTINELESELDPSQFLRIHRGILVNLAYVDEAHQWFGGRLLIRLRDGNQSELTVARDRVRELKDRLGF